MVKRQHDCGHCGQLFATITDHMIHVSRVHYDGYKSRGERLLRTLACWRCAEQMVPPNYECKCGFVLPKNWVNGQLTLDESQDEKEDKC